MMNETPIINHVDDQDMTKKKKKKELRKFPGGKEEKYSAVVNKAEENRCL